MKKHVKRFLALLTGAALCAGLCIPAMAANENNTLGITFSAVLSQDSVNISEESQTVTATLQLSREMTIDSMEFVVAADEPLVTLTETAPTDVPSGFSSWGWPNASKLTWINLTPQATTTFGTVEITIPGNTPAGDYEIRFQGIKASDTTQFGNTNWESAAVATAILTVVDPDASTGAQLSTQAASVSVGGSTTLTASLLPAATTETISGITWSSSDDAVATVSGDASGATVTGVGEGAATITAEITTSANRTYTETCDITVNAAPTSPYTVTISDGVTGTAKVVPGDAVTMNLSISGGAFTGAEGTVTYDSELFTYVSASAPAGDGINSSVSVSNGVITYDVENTTDFTDGSSFLTLVFTANPVNEDKTGDFTLGTTSTASVATVTNGESHYLAAPVNDSVEVLTSFTVTLVDGEEVFYSEAVVSGGTLTVAAITDPTKDNYEFLGWTDGENTYTTAQLADLTIHGPVTLTAKYQPKSYSVTLPADGSLTGAGTATYGTDYTVTVADYDGANWTYAVKYTVGDSAAALSAADNSDGTFTVPGDAITGDITVSVEKTLAGATVTVTQNYVNGYTLVVVRNEAGNSGVVYTYQGNAMYNDAIHGGYAWLAEGGVDADQAKALVGIGATAAGTITDGLDVNNSGSVGYEDKAAVWYCVKMANYDPITNMDVYLRADLDKNGYVTVSDLEKLR